jgi:D-sedoheptulose 7-phosphate isomerase
MNIEEKISAYRLSLSEALQLPAMENVPKLGHDLLEAWRHKKTIYLCGNGGSAGNAIHIANDFIYGAGIANGIGLRIEALSSNQAVITCLGNDIGYDKIYSEQLRVKGNPGDILIALSGSGNSPNIISAIEMANKQGMITHAILGFSGGKCKEIAHNPIHFAIDDMQIAEDLQLIICHICMQWLSVQKI